MSSSAVTVVLAHGAWADGSSWAKGHRFAGGRGHQGGGGAAAADIVQRRRRGARTNAGPRDGAGRSRRPRLCRGRDRGHTEREGEGARLRGCSRSGRGRNGCRTFSIALSRIRRRPSSRPTINGLIYLPEAAFAAAFAQHASAEEQALLAAVQRPISTACITAAAGRPLWKDRPSWFLVAEEDRMIVPETQRFMAARMKARVRSHQVDHTPIVTAPGVVVEIIRDALHVTSPRSRRCGRRRKQWNCNLC